MGLWTLLLEFYGPKNKIKPIVMRRQDNQALTWIAKELLQLSLGQLIMKPVDDQFLKKQKTKTSSFHALQKERLPWSLLKGIIMQLSFLLDSMLSKLTLSCIVSSRAPNRQLDSQPPLGPWAAWGQSVYDSLYHTGPMNLDWGARRKKLSMPLCLRGPEELCTQISRPRSEPRQHFYFRFW